MQSTDEYSASDFWHILDYTIKFLDRRIVRKKQCNAVHMNNEVIPFQMYGRYQRDLSEAAREEARRLRRLRKRRRKDDKLRQKELEATGKHRPRGKVFKVLGEILQSTSRLNKV